MRARLHGVRSAWLLAPLLALALSGCQGEDTPGDGPSPETPAASATASGGTASEPGVPQPGRDLLDWSPVPGSDGATVTSNGEWTLAVPDGGRSYTLSQGSEATTVRLAGRRVTDALLGETWAVIASQDNAEERPQRAVAIELATGRRTVIDGGSPIPTTVGGTWALDGDRVAYATLAGRDYCLAYRDLAADTSRKGPCVGAREGFNNVHLGAAGDTLLRFGLGGGRSCRTIASVEGTSLTPFPSVATCSGAEGVLLAGGSVWSVVPREQRFEEVRVRARAGDAQYDLGPGSNGTLVACGGAAYFSRDAQTGDGTATLLRWDGEHLDVVYESKPGQAVLSEPRCGGDQLTVTSLAEGGDEQVTAPLS